MKLHLIFLKTLREMTRDLWVVGLTLAFAPAFVGLYWLWFYGGSTSYTVLVINQDAGAARAEGSGPRLAAGQEAAAAIAAMTYADGKPLLKIAPASSRAEAEAILRGRGAVVFIEFPSDFSHTVLALQHGDRSATSQITFGGDLTNPYYAVGSVLALTAVDSYVQQSTGQAPLIGYTELPLEGSAARSEFETYVPGVLILAVILLIFQAAMTVAREIESGALRRLQLTPMTAFDLLGGITLALTLVGAAGVGLTFATAMALGFRSQGSVWLAILIGALTSLSIIGIGMVVACFARTVSQAFVVANFPLALLMFFSGAIFPVPKIELFTLSGYSVALYDLLPATHAVNALNKILTLGAGAGEIGYELIALSGLSVLYFAIGVGLFKKMHLS